MEDWRTRLRERIDQYGAAQLARDLGVSESTISRYKSANRTPDPGMLRRLCIQLDISADWLLGLDPATAPLDEDLEEGLELLRSALEVLTRTARARAVIAKAEGKDLGGPGTAAGGDG